MPTYQLIRLAGSYDLRLGSEIVASLVRSPDHRHQAATWYAELLNEHGLGRCHFQSRCTKSFEEAAEWLGNPEIVTSEPIS